MFRYIKIVHLCFASIDNALSPAYAWYVSTENMIIDDEHTAVCTLRPQMCRQCTEHTMLRYCQYASDKDEVYGTCVLQSQWTLKGPKWHKVVFFISLKRLPA